MRRLRRLFRRLLDYLDWDLVAGVAIIVGGAAMLILPYLWAIYYPRSGVPLWDDYLQRCGVVALPFSLITLVVTLLQAYLGY